MSLERREKYRLELTPRFDKELHKLPKHVMSRIAENIEELKVNPHSFKRLQTAWTWTESSTGTEERTSYALAFLDETGRCNGLRQGCGEDI